MARVICQPPSTDCSTCPLQHLRLLLFRFCWSYSLEFTAWQSVQFSCWARPVLTDSENPPDCLFFFLLYTATVHSHQWNEEQTSSHQQCGTSSVVRHTGTVCCRSAPNRRFPKPEPWQLPHGSPWGRRCRSSVDEHHCWWFWFSPGQAFNVELDNTQCLADRQHQFRMVDWVGFGLLDWTIARSVPKCWSNGPVTAVAVAGEPQGEAMATAGQCWCWPIRVNSSANSW